MSIPILRRQVLLGDRLPVLEMRGNPIPDFVLLVEEGESGEGEGEDSSGEEQVLNIFGTVLAKQPAEVVGEVCEDL